MKAVCSSETLVTVHETTLCNNPKGNNLNLQHCRLCLYAGEMFTGGVTTTSRKPYVLDPSVQAVPQYGGTGSRYPGGFNTSPVPNSPSVPSYPNKPASTVYSAADVYNPAGNVNVQPGGMPQGIPAVNAPSGWNDPPVLKNSSQAQVHKHDYMSLCFPSFCTGNVHYIYFCLPAVLAEQVHIHCT